jgi:hypothetical protein
MHALRQTHYQLCIDGTAPRGDTSIGVDVQDIAAGRGGEPKC